MLSLGRWLLLLLLLAPTPAPAQFGGCLPGFCGTVQSVASCAESVAFIARTSGLDAAHKNNYHRLICGLVADGIWSNLDALYTFATKDQTTANLNLKSASFTAVAAGGPAWVADRGYTGVESSTS